MIDSATIEQVEGHPLDGLCNAERQKARCAALGQVLAAIARRQNDKADCETTDSTQEKWGNGKCN